MTQKAVLSALDEMFDVGVEREFDEFFELFMEWENDHEDIPLIIHYRHSDGLDFIFPVFEFPYYVGYSLGIVTITDLGVTEEAFDEEGSYYCAVIKLEQPTLRS